MSFRALGVGSGWVCAPQFCAITSGSTPKRAHHCGSLGAMHLAMITRQIGVNSSLTLRPSAQGWASRTDTPIDETKPIFAVA